MSATITGFVEGHEQRSADFESRTRKQFMYKQTKNK